MTLILSGTDGVSDIDGTAATPAIRGTDANTGIFFPAADTIAFSEGGVESMRIDSSGNVRIGTTATLSTYRLVTRTGNIAFEPANGNTDMQILLGMGSTTSGTSAGSGIKSNINVAFEGSNDNFYQGFGYVTTTANQTRINSAADFYIETKKAGDSNATERMRIDSSGNVIVGATDPTTGDRVVITKTYNGNNGYSGDRSAVVLADGTVIGSIQAHSGGSQLIIGTESNHRINFGTNNNERATITTGGYFKASNNGTYINSTGTYHEFYQTADGSTLWGTGYNNSYTNAVIATQVQRSANAAYSFFDGYSGLSDLEFRLYGDGNGRCDGAWTGGGADYAEYFESANGQALTLGATVVLDGNKVREATDQDPASAIIGVVRPKEPSKASAMIGNAAWNKWAKKYLTDDFDRYIMEDHDVVEWEEQVLEREAVAAVEAVVDEEGNEVSPAVPAQEAVYKTVSHSYESHNIPAGVTVPTDAVRKTHDDKGNKFQHYKLNPAWDKDAEYVNRENRPEWNIIGLLGQVKILKGQPVGDRWIKMRDVSATVEEWMIR